MSEYSKTAGIGAGATTAGATGVIASGMSAAQITGTLATIGSTVGGGMAVGLGIVAAAPLAVGLIMYSIFEIFD